MTTYSELISYFENFSAIIQGLNGVTVGNDEAIMDLQNTQIRYPHLWVETPDVRFVGTDENPAYRFNFGLVIIDNDNLRTNQAGNTKLSAMLDLAAKVYEKILKDSDDDCFDLILNDNEGDPIRQWSGDNAYGWRIQISLEIPRCEC